MTFFWGCVVFVAVLLAFFGWAICAGGAMADRERL
jgi:hypothetical protein